MKFNRGKKTGKPRSSLIRLLTDSYTTLEVDFFLLSYTRRCGIQNKITRFGPIVHKKFQLQVKLKRKTAATDVKYEM